ncbi:hypothetical protein CLI92_08210 [Vandammella animalimorsus]|uniref:HTH marR-type domain-containing protein n=1 Tax=Vandammella animalimorsus TaxID=2029117 RepID=A0A2A2T576_9BURK|nr:hypothetical protein CK626_05735 [Vandammella animalimorsus]PAX16700.1 hypothetical protein CLI92_08210 [Vandammella animalimorsus]PAX19330.1 hypothetical protein CLI93_09230 [Vandammella animalimorsus]
MHGSCRLNDEDTHVVNYALKKLVAAGLAVGEKTGKEVFYSPSERDQLAVSHCFSSPLISFPA